MLWTDGMEPSYKWNTGSTQNQIYAVEEGKYWVTATNECGDLSDSIKITHFNATLNVNLGKDTLLCSGKSLTINARHEEST